MSLFASFGAEGRDSITDVVVFGRPCSLADSAAGLDLGRLDPGFELGGLVRAHRGPCHRLPSRPFRLSLTPPSLPPPQAQPTPGPTAESAAGRVWIWLDMAWRRWPLLDDREPTHGLWVSFLATARLQITFNLDMFKLFNFKLLQKHPISVSKYKKKTTLEQP